MVAEFKSSKNGEAEVHTGVFTRLEESFPSVGLDLGWQRGVIESFLVESSSLGVRVVRRDHLLLVGWRGRCVICVCNLVTQGLRILRSFE